MMRAAATAPIKDALREATQLAWVAESAAYRRCASASACSSATISWSSRPKRWKAPDRALSHRVTRTPAAVRLRALFAHWTDAEPKEACDGRKDVVGAFDRCRIRAGADAGRHARVGRCRAEIVRQLLREEPVGRDLRAERQPCSDAVHELRFGRQHQRVLGQPQAATAQRRVQLRQADDRSDGPTAAVQRDSGQSERAVHRQLQGRQVHRQGAPRRLDLPRGELHGSLQHCSAAAAATDDRTGWGGGQKRGGLRYSRAGCRTGGGLGRGQGGGGAARLEVPKGAAQGRSKPAVGPLANASTEGLSSARHDREIRLAEPDSAVVAASGGPRSRTSRCGFGDHRVTDTPVPRVRGF